MDVKRIILITVETIVFVIAYVTMQTANSWIPVSQRGFHCNDPSLSLPMMPNSVPSAMIVVTIYVIPLVVFLAELACNACSTLKDLLIISWQWMMWFKSYYFVFMCEMIFMLFVKNQLGVYRPFFLEVCQPDLAINCTTGTYIRADYECTNKQTLEILVTESKKSFPSGHVCVSVYSCFFLMWYLQTRFSKTPLYLTLLHLTCCLWIALCSVTRITDNWHHWFDVVGGAVLTLPFVVYSCHVLCKNFKPSVGTFPFSSSSRSQGDVVIPLE